MGEKLTTFEKVKNPKRVEQVKRLAAISKEANARKAAEREKVKNPKRVEQVKRLAAISREAKARKTAEREKVNVWVYSRYFSR